MLFTSPITLLLIVVIKKTICRFAVGGGVVYAYDLHVHAYTFCTLCIYKGLGIQDTLYTYRLTDMLFPTLYTICMLYMPLFFVWV